MTGQFWRSEAACRDHIPELWFPSPKAADSHRWDAPRAICGACPVRDACLTHALDVGEDYGMFGGLTPEERTRIKRRPRRVPRKAPAPCGTEAGYRRHVRDHTGICQPCRDAASKARRYREAAS